MGLKLKPFINRNGYYIENAYYELERIEYNITIHSISFFGNIYLSKEHKDQGYYPIDAFEDGFEIDSLPEEPIKYIYNYIRDRANNNKEDLAYKGFIDCELIEEA